MSLGFRFQGSSLQQSSAKQGFDEKIFDHVTNLTAVSAVPGPDLA